MYQVNSKTVFGLFLCILGVSMFIDVPVFRLLIAGVLVYLGANMIHESQNKYRD